jgi:hypothetical protein
MIDFEGLKNLFKLLKVKHTPKKHWLNFVGWGITDLMNQVLLQSTHNVVNVINILFMNVDEMTTIDNASWNFLHLAVGQGWN